MLTGLHHWLLIFYKAGECDSFCFLLFKPKVSYMVVLWLKEGGTQQLNQWAVFYVSSWLGELLSLLLAGQEAFHVPRHGITQPHKQVCVLLWCIKKLSGKEYDTIVLQWRPTQWSISVKRLTSEMFLSVSFRFSSNFRSMPTIPTARVLPACRSTRDEKENF